MKSEIAPNSAAQATRGASVPPIAGTYIDIAKVAATRKRLARRSFREVISSDDARADHQRVVPLPLTFAAILLPIVAAWATAAPGTPKVAAAEQVRAHQVDAAGDALRRAALHFEPTLGRGRSQGDSSLASGAAAPGYVDLWAKPCDWEAALLERRGYQSAVRR